MPPYVFDMKTHEYHTHIIWDGNQGLGTSNWTGYGRNHRILVSGKPELMGSAHPSFRGEPDRHDPEDLFLAAIASCHMLAYLALCARHGVNVVSYDDRASGSLVLEPRGGGRFEEVTLRPTVTITGGDRARAAELHDRAHELCFIANSCRVPIRNEPTTRVEDVA
jgi:organic hydroperoxide reductase OsmC/OhrA